MPAKVRVRFGGQEIAVHELTKPTTVVGRDPRNDVHIDNLGISRTHCQFVQRGAAYVLQDLNSSNGTYVNGRRVGEHFLNDKDEILIGKYSLLFENPEQAAAPVQPANPRLVADSVNTYVMDGREVRERIAAAARAGVLAPTEAGARGAAGAGAAGAAAPAGAAGTGARRTVKPVVETGVSPLAIFLIAVAVLLLLVVGVLVWKQLHPAAGGGGGGGRPPVTAPPASPAPPAAGSPAPGTPAPE